MFLLNAVLVYLTNIIKTVILVSTFSSFHSTKNYKSIFLLPGHEQGHVTIQFGSKTFKAINSPNIETTCI